MQTLFFPYKLYFPRANFISPKQTLSFACKLYFSHANSIFRMQILRTTFLLRFCEKNFHGKPILALARKAHQPRNCSVVTVPTRRSFSSQPFERLWRKVLTNGYFCTSYQLGWGLQGKFHSLPWKKRMFVPRLCISPEEVALKQFFARQSFSPCTAFWKAEERSLSTCC